MTVSATITRSSQRQIAARTRGDSHGPITRLMSPSDFGQLLKPFVFLDLFDDKGAPLRALGSTRIQASRRSPTLSRAVSAMKTPTAQPACCLPAASSGCEPAAAYGMAAAQANRDERVAFSFGSPCRRSSSSGHP